MSLVSVSSDLANQQRKEANEALERQHEEKRCTDEIKKEEGMQKVRCEYIKCLDFYRLWFQSDSCWKTRRDVRKGLGKINTKGGKLDALKMNIQIRYLGFGWVECHTTWSKDGKNKTVKQLKARLIEIMNMTRDKEVPMRLYPKKFGLAAQKDNLPVLGQLTEAVKYIYESSAAGNQELDIQSPKEWKEREESSQDEGMRFRMQQPGDRLTLDATFVGTRIQYLAEFGEDESEESKDDNSDSEIKTNMHWCTGTIEEIYDEGPSALVSWDAIPRFDYPASQTVEDFPANKFKCKCVGGWIGYKEVDYGL